MLYYEKRGKGPAVVLLHGLPCNHTVWNNLTDKLSGRFTFILPDFPGAGQSAEKTSDFSLKEVAQEIEEILKAENIGKAIMAGHSMGGYTVMAFAKMFPEKVKAISLIHSSAAADTEEKKQIRRKSIALIEKGDTAKTAFVKALIKSLFDENFVKRHPEVVSAAFQTGNQLSVKTLVQFYKALMNREDTTSLLPNLPFPVQWILGEYDQAIELRNTLPITHLARINDICIYPDCGHMSMLELPEKLANDLNRFWHFAY